MPVLSMAPKPVELSALFDRLNSESRRHDELVAMWKSRVQEGPYLADLLGRRMAQAGSFMASDALAIATFAGIDEDTFALMMDAAGKGNMANGQLVLEGQDQSSFDEALELDRLRLGFNPLGSMLVQTKANEEFGGDYQAAIEAIKERDANRGKGDGPWGLWALAKGIGRTAFIGAQSGYEFATNVGGDMYEGAMNAMGSPGRTHAGSAPSRTATTPQRSPFELLQATTGGQAVASIVKGEGIDAGSGWFPAGNLQKQTTQRIQEVRPQVAPGVTFTFGRAAAVTAYEPNTVGFNVMSGFIDAGAAIYLDPLNYVGGAGAFGHVPSLRRAVTATADEAGLIRTAANLADEEWQPSRAREVAMGRIDAPDYMGIDDVISQAELARYKFNEADEILEELADSSNIYKPKFFERRRSAEWLQTVHDQAGFIEKGRNGVRRSVYAPQAMRHLLSEAGRKTVQALRQEESGQRIWLAMGKKVPAPLAYSLADARTDEQVIELLGKAFGSGEIKQFPTMGTWKGKWNGVTIGVADRSRMLGMLPDTYMDPNDPDKAMRNLYDSLGNAKILGQERQGLMDNWGKAMATGIQSAQYEVFDEIGKKVAAKIAEGGASQGMVNAIMDWRRGYGRDIAWLTDEFGSGITSDFLGKHGPTRISEGLQRGISLYDPTKIADVRAWSSTVGRLMNKSKVVRPIESGINALQQGIWKPLVLIRPAYLVRVNGEEVVRAALGGSFQHTSDFLLAIIGHGQGDGLFNKVFAQVGGRYGTDIRGVQFDIRRAIERIDSQIEDLTASGGDITKLMAERTRLNDDLARGFEQNYKEALVGASRSKAMAAGSLRDDYINEYAIRTGNFRKVVKGHDDYVAGWAEELGRMHADPILKRVANGGLFKQDLAVSGTNGMGGLDEILDWIMADGEQSLTRIKTMWSDIDWTRENVKMWLDHQIADVAHFTGNNGDLRSIVATGLHDGKAAFTTEFNGASKITDSGHNFLLAQQQASDAPEWVRASQVVYNTKEAGIKGAGMEARNKIISWFFGGLYGKTSDYLARSPTFRRHYWDEIEKLAPLLSHEEAAKVMKNLDKVKLNAGVRDRIRTSLAAASGDETMDAIDLVAKGYALDRTNSLLVEAGRKSQFFDMAKILLPFGEAWKEQVTTWFNLLTRRPRAANSIRKVLVAGRDADPDGDGQGILHSNQYGEEVFTIPWSGAAAEAFAGVNVRFDIPIMGMSQATQIVPGIGPMASFLVADMIPNTPNGRDFAELIMPFGAPQEKGQYISNIIGPPSALAKIATGIPVVRNVMEWFTELDNPQKNVMFGNTYMQVYDQLAASGDYNLKDMTDLDRMDKDAMDKARKIVMMRGLFQFVGPASPTPSYIIETMQGDMNVGRMADDLFRMEQEDYDTAIPRFLEKYGDNAFIYLGSKNVANIQGMEATEPWAQFMHDNPEILDKYPNVGGYLAPAGTEFSQDIFNQQKLQGDRSLRPSGRDQLRDANDKYAKMIYYAAKDKIGDNPTANQDAWLNQVRDDLEEDFPGFKLTGESRDMRRQQIQELEEAVTDPQVTALPFGQALQIYMGRRDEVLSAQSGLGMSTANISSSKRVANLREYLRTAGNELAEDFPEFERVWKRVLERELGEPVVVEELVS